MCFRDGVDVDLHVIDVLLGAARARVAAVVGRDRQRVGRDSRDVHVARVEQTGQGCVHIGDVAENGQVVRSTGRVSALARAPGSARPIARGPATARSSTQVRELK